MPKKALPPVRGLVAREHPAKLRAAHSGQGGGTNSEVFSVHRNVPLGAAAPHPPLTETLPEPPCFLPVGQPELSTALAPHPVYLPAKYLGGKCSIPPLLVC